MAKTADNNIHQPWKTEKLYSSVEIASNLVNVEDENCKQTADKKMTEILPYDPGLLSRMLLLG